MKLIVAFYSLLIFSGCAVPTKVTSPENFSISTPQLNSQQEIEIGISLVSKESGFKYKALRILKDTKIKTGYLLKEIKEGEIFINNSYTSKYDLYSKIDGSTFGIALPKSGGKAISFYIPGTGITFNKNNNMTIEYKELLTPIPKKEYLKQDFIYNGKVGNAIKFTYREFVDDLARPAFTQDLQYDLTESNVIGFRGLRIEILSATNTKIEYKVLTHFDK
jgi:hypothetical protein